MGDAPATTTSAFGATPVPKPSESSLPRGSVVGRYVVIGEIRRSGMGGIYTAWDPDLGRRIALKLLHATPANLHVLREAKALAKLSHRNVVQVFEIVKHDDDRLIAMEYVEGETLVGP